MNAPNRLYSVVRSEGKTWKRSTVATGLVYESAKRLCEQLDAEYKNKVIARGKHYSTWTADLHECQLEEMTPEKVQP